jgi:hypothetical protein
VIQGDRHAMMKFNLRAHPHFQRQKDRPIGVAEEIKQQRLPKIESLMIFFLLGILLEILEEVSVEN